MNTKKMKRSLSLLLAACMCITMFTCMTITSFAGSEQSPELSAAEAENMPLKLLAKTYTIEKIGETITANLGIDEALLPEGTKICALEGVFSVTSVGAPAVTLGAVTSRTIEVGTCATPGGVSWTGEPVNIGTDQVIAYVPVTFPDTAAAGQKYTLNFTASKLVLKNDGETEKEYKTQKTFSTTVSVAEEGTYDTECMNFTMKFYNKSGDEITSAAEGDDVTAKVTLSISPGAIRKFNQETVTEDAVYFNCYQLSLMDKQDSVEFVTESSVVLELDSNGNPCYRNDGVIVVDNFISAAWFNLVNEVGLPMYTRDDDTLFESRVSPVAIFNFKVKKSVENLFDQPGKPGVISVSTALAGTDIFGNDQYEPQLTADLKVLPAFELSLGGTEANRVLNLTCRNNDTFKSGYAMLAFYDENGKMIELEKSEQITFEKTTNKKVMEKNVPEGAVSCKAFLTNSSYMPISANARS